MPNRKVLIRLVVITGGVGLLLLSLFAFQLGLDNDPGWGPRRSQILGAGIALIFFGMLYWITPALSHWLESIVKPALARVTLSRGARASMQKTMTGFEETVAGSRPAGNIQRPGWFVPVSKNRTTLWLLLTACLVIWSYVWILTIGTMTKWPSGRNYYGMLAQAFLKGQTSLLVEPPAELLKLENPYDLNQRRGLDYLWDTTLYNGKYYLYWGPVPAVLGALFTLITGRPVSDAGLLVLFVTGTVLFSMLLLRKIFQDYQLSEWILLGGVLACAINIPLIWLFTHPAYYEASIAGGQFFMMAGFLLLYLAFRSSTLQNRFLLFSAVAFGLAGGTRISLLPSVIFLAFLILLRVYVVRSRDLRASALAFAAVLVSLAIIISSLLLYNYIRFGSIFEFGHRYQLTGLASTEEYSDQVSIRYIVPSLYSYVFRPPAFQERFPFVTIPAIKQNMWPFFINPPENYYYAEPLAGILLTIPLIGFAAIVLLRLFWLLINGDVFIKKIGHSVDNVFIWFGAALLGYVFIQTLLLLVFVSTSMRYLFDVSPVFLVLSSMFIGIHLRSFEEKSYWVKIIINLWLFLAVLTVIMGFLIGFTGGQNNFLNKNPQLYYRILEWFNR